jgi:hypothetical protein
VTAESKALAAWVSIPRDIRRATRGLSDRDLKARGGSEGWSIREYAHHLGEANLIASNIILAALGRPGSTYDWSWVLPDRKWMKRLGYDRAPLDPALDLLEALCAHVAGLARSAPGSMKSAVRLLGSPGTRPRRRTVKQVLDDEREHARHHLRDIADTRSSQSRVRKRPRSSR